MKRVRVWLENDESDRTHHEFWGQKVEAYIPASRSCVGECNATVDDVAELLLTELDAVSLAKVQEALDAPGTRVRVGEVYEGDVSAKLYLVIEYV